MSLSNSSVMSVCFASGPSAFSCCAGRTVVVQLPLCECGSLRIRELLT